MAKYVPQVGKFIPSGKAKPKPKARRAPRRTASPRDVDALLGTQAVSAPEEGKVVRVRARPRSIPQAAVPAARGRVTKEPAQKGRVTYRPKPKPEKAPRTEWKEKPRGFVPVTKKEEKALRKLPPKKRQKAAARLPGKRVEQEAAGLGISKKIVEQGITTGKQIPAGMLEAGLAAPLDVRDIARGRVPKHTAKLVKESAKGMYGALRHPHEHPFEVATMGLGAAAGVAAGVERVGLAGAAIRAARAGKVAEAAKIVTPQPRPYVSKPGLEGLGSIPDRAREPGYFYHRSSAEKFEDLKKSGLKPQKPAGAPAGVYFGNEPLQAVGLSWKKRDSIYLRARKDSVPGVVEKAFGESHTARAVPPRNLEYLGEDGNWHPLVGREAPAAVQPGALRAGARAAFGRRQPGQRIVGRGEPNLLHPKGEPIFGIESKSALGRHLQRLTDQSPDEVFFPNLPGSFRAPSLRPGGKAGQARFVQRQEQQNAAVRAAVRNEPSEAARMPDPRLDKYRHKDIPLDAWDAANSLTKLFLIYGKLGYIPANLLGNVSLNLIQSGFLALPHLARSTRLHRTLGPEDTTWFDGLMGGGMAKSFIQHEGRDPLHIERGVGKVADILGSVTDRYTRRASLLHELWRDGYRTKAQIKKLREDVKHNPELEDKLIGIVRRARNEAIDYEQVIGHREKTYLRRALFVYPWVKGSTRYAGQFVREHPFQTPVYTELARQAQEKQERDLGPVPSYYEGIMRIGGSRDRPLIIDPRAASIFQTPAEVAEAAMAVATGQFSRGTPADFLGPLVSDIAYPFFTGHDIRTGREIGRGEMFKEFARGIPAVGAVVPPEPRKGGIPQRTPLQSRLRFLGGGPTPATFSRAALNRKALEQKKTGWNPEKRASYSIQQSKQDFIDELARLKVPLFTKDGRLIPLLDKTWKLREERARATAKIKSSPPGATKEDLADYQREALNAELDRAAELGLRDLKTGDVMTPKAAAFVKKQAAKSTSPRALGRLRNYVRDYYYAESVISKIKREAGQDFGAEFRR